MTFSDVLKGLYNGLPVYRDRWNNGRYIYYESNKDLFVDNYPSIDVDISTALMPLLGTDLFADDWQVGEWEDEENHIVSSNKKEVVE
jgi:hypothetical protein